ncbi:MAG: hypothetical protein J7642_04975 [Cyanobacteria bacterium SBC]|nr:hypothetical protein [Cyanobacteria bacterium SBC]
MVDAGFGGIEPHSANGETPGISTLRLRLQRGTYVLALLEVKSHFTSHQSPVTSYQLPVASYPCFPMYSIA